MPPLDDAGAARLAQLALDCVHRPYPHHVSHRLDGDDDARPPRELTPAFWGCYDWHSAVHGHWLLARVARRFPEAPNAAACRAALARSLTDPHLHGELAYLRVPGRAAFERPYGLAWLVTLAAELRAWDDPAAARWSAALAPLERHCAARLDEHFARLPRPVRSGQHPQTAFALGLALDHARAAGDGARTAALGGHARRLFAGDRAYPFGYEPSGHDFLSPGLAAADVVRRVLPREAFGAWLAAYAPALSAGDGAWLAPVAVGDPADGHAVHLAGLDLSRAWMLAALARAVGPADPRAAVLEAMAAAHATAGLGYVTDEHYAGAHWLGTFALYLLDGGGG